MENTNEFAKKLREISDLAFANGSDSVSEATKRKDIEKWSAVERKEFIVKCHDGFKAAQKRIIEEVTLYQKLLTETKNRLKVARVAKEKSEVQEQLNAEKVIEHRLLNLSHIADGIAWQLLQNQTHNARRLHIGQSSRKVLENSNIDHAVRVANRINENPMSFALISDITGFVQIGDLLVLKEDGLGIVELKEGKVNAKIQQFFKEFSQDAEAAKIKYKDEFDENALNQMDRMLRQEQRALNATDVINNDKGTDPRTGGNITVNTPTQDIENYYGVLYTMEKNLGEKNWEYDVVDECLHIGFYQGEVGQIMARGAIAELLKMKTENYIVADLMSITSAVSEPLHAKPFSREFITKLMTGEVRAIIGIDMDELIKVFNENGLKTRLMSTKETAKLKSTANGKNIVTVKNRAIGIMMPNGVEACMSGGIISKILYDSLVPSSLAAAIATAKKPDEEGAADK